MTAPALSIIIVNWNTGRLLGDCLRAIARETPDLSHEVIVVDNASSDDSAALVRRDFPQVRLLESGGNRGYAGGNNLAFPLARGDFVALLNPDTLVEDRALERLVAFLRARPAVGAVGPRLLDPDGRYAIRNGGHQPTTLTLLAHYGGLSRLSGGRVRGLHTVTDRRQRVGWLSGACLVVRRAVVDSVGPLREDWFLYAEDVEWCDRIGAHGWQLWYEPAARVVHLDRRSTSQRGRSFSTRWAHGLHHHFVRRTGASRARVMAFDAVLAGGLLSRALLYLLRSTRPARREQWRDEARSFVRGAVEILRLGWKTR